MSYNDLQQILIITLISGFIAVTLWECIAPAVPPSTWGNWAKHFAKNFILWVLGMGLIHVIFADAPTTSALWAEHYKVGLFTLLKIPTVITLALGFLIVDFSDYILHRLMHNWRPLWLIHSVHHSDTHLDVSTNFRAHPLQPAALIIWKLLVTFAFGIPLWILLLRELIVIPISQLHHANIRWSLLAERCVGWLFVTPAMHRLHHSPAQPLTDSNYGELFSFWDKLLGTYSYEGAIVKGPFGLNELSASKWQTLWGMLRTPFAANDYKKRS